MRALAIVLALTGVASADSVTTPWALDRARSATMEQADHGLSHFGAATSPNDSTTISAYFPPTPGTGLIVSKYTTSAPREAAVPAVVADFESWPNPASGMTITERATQREVTDGLIAITLGGHEATAEMRYVFRMVVGADARGVVAVVGQCFARDDASAADVAACRAALATLDTGIPADQRVALALPATVAAPVVPVELAPLPELGGKPAASQPTIGTRKGPLIALPPPPPETDRRPIYIGVGIVVLAFAFWWNRKQRDRFAEDRRAPGRDEDDDALHDAATQAADKEKPSS